jgi:DNA gyrase subunit A
METSLIRQIDIDDEMRGAYLDYAMSVIVSRALPDARDGLKPVHRRILYAMYSMGLRPDSPYKKSARIVGEVLGKYHPHGDASVYDAMVRMAQDFSMRYELVDGQGNFGSIDGDAPAAMRYTEARMDAFGMELMQDITKETVDFVDNFDGSLTEPAVLPAAIPNLLVNGSSGIAVGMSTNIPPHNLGEVCDAVVYMLENWEHYDEITVKDLMQFIKGPDFPTAGIIFTGEGENNGLISAYATGRGKITMRAKAHIEDIGRGRSQIIVTEIPFQTNKTSLIERIVEIVQEGRIEGLVDLRDESDRHGLRLVIEIGRQADPHEILEQLFKYTPLQATYGIIMLALLDGEPRTLTLKQLLRAFIEHRLEVIKRRSEYDLARAEERAHILEGLLKAIDNIDQAIDIIRRSRNTETAHANLMKAFSLSDAQATAILEMQLRRLAALERKKLEDELKEKLKLIKDLKLLLSSQKLMRLEIAREIKLIRETYADERRTIIAESEATAVTAETLLGNQQDTWVTLTIEGNVSIPYDNEPPKVTADMKEPPLRVVQSNPSDVLYFITEEGMCATVLTAQIPKANDIREGIPFWKLCDLSEKDKVVAVLNVPVSLETGYVFFATEGGEVKRLSLEDLPGLRSTAFRLFDVEKDDKLHWAYLVNEEDNTILVTRAGQAIHFPVSDVRPTGLSAGGMRGIKLADEGDRVVGAGVVGKFTHVWIVTDGGIGKRSSAEEYPVQGRAGQGVRTFRFPPGNDNGLAAALMGQLDEEIVVLTTKRKAKRNRITNATPAKRDYKGSNIVSLAQGEQVAEAFIFEPRLVVVEET